MKNTLNNWKLWLVVSLTLGLAPFVPEPHLFGKIRWIWGGAIGMKAIDWYDFVQHGFPWIFLVRALVLKLKTKEKV